MRSPNRWQMFRVEGVAVVPPGSTEPRHFQSVPRGGPVGGCPTDRATGGDRHLEGEWAKGKRAV